MATRYSQPQRGARIDWANPLTSRLSTAIVFNGPAYDAVSGSLLTSTSFGSAPNISAGTKGLGLAGSGGGVALTGKNFQLPSEYTVTCLVSLSAVDASYGGVISIANSAGTETAFQIQRGSATDAFAVSTSTASYGVASGGSISGLVGKYACITFTRTASGTKLVINAVATTGTAGTVGTIGNGRIVIFGERASSATTGSDGLAYGLYIHNRALSDAEIKSLSDNPWQLFAPVSRAIWVPVSAGSTGYTLTADQASYTLSGADATLTYTGSRTLTADSGAYSLTGNAATLAFNRNLAATQATYTLTGDAANLAFNRVLGADTVGYSLTGNTATLAFNRVLGADTVGYSLTGSAATLDYTPITGATYTLPAASTDFALTPSDAALIAARKVVADAYAAVLAGADATLTYTPAALPTIGRPASDTSNSGWTASTGTDLFAMVDEVTPDPLDYIVTTATGSVCELALEQTAYPGTASQALKYRASSSTGNSLIVRLKNGATTIRTETQALTATDTEYVITLTSGEIAAITSGSLSVELESA
jgi:hypothetical protein